MKITVSILVILFVWAAGANAEEPERSAGLLLHADFERTAASPGPGKLVSASNPLTYEDGKKGSGLRIFANRQFDLVYRLPEALSPRKGWTFTCWLKPSESHLRNLQDNMLLLRLQNSHQWEKGNVHIYFCRWGMLRVAQNCGDGKWHENTIPAKRFAEGEWRFLAVVCENSRIRIFIDGEEVKPQKQEEFTAPEAQTQVRVGTCGIPKANYDGLIDGLMVFNHPLDANGIRRRQLLSSENGDALPFPVLFLPLNGKIDPIYGAGQPEAAIASENVGFKPAVKGRGGEFRRMGYDRASFLRFSGFSGAVPEIMTVAFDFIPEQVGDEHFRCLAAATAPNGAWTIARQGNLLLFELKSPMGTDTLSVPCDWTLGQARAIAALYDENEMSLWIDGTCAGRKKRNFPCRFSTAAGVVSIGDLPRPDMYRISQSEGVLDEFRLFRMTLVPAQLRKLADLSISEDKETFRLDHWNFPEQPPSEAEKKWWDLDGAKETGNSFRTSVTLNALWRFRPLPPEGVPLPETWYHFPVPGRIHAESWSDHVFHPRDREGKPIIGNFLPDGTKLSNIRETCWEREFRLRPEWRSKHLELRFDAFSSETGRLFLNGKFLLELKGRHSHRVLLPPEMLRDGSNFLQLILSDSRVPGWSGHWRGIRGNVFLDILPDLYGDKPTIVTSVSNKELRVRVPVHNFSGAPQQCAVNIRIDGERAPALRQKSFESIPPGGDRICEVLIPWDSPRLWSPANPYLYRLDIELQGNGGQPIDRLPEQRFGFREFNIDGKNYSLNGNAIHLYNTEEWKANTFDPEEARQYLRDLKTLGFNSIRLGFNTMDDDVRTMANIADEEGVMLFVNAYGVNAQEYSNWNDPATRHVLEDEMHGLVEDLRNHPSIVLWYLSVNFGGNPLDYHPYEMNFEHIVPGTAEKFKLMAEGAKILLKYDSTRPFFYQAAGAFGPIINANAYFGWWPQAERRAWAEEWAKIGEKPLHIIETSFPYIRSFEGMSRGLFDAEKIRFYFEDCARYFGNAAYDASDAVLLAAAQESRAGKEVGWFDERCRRSPLLMKLKAWLIRDTIPYWRMSGISGICPFAEQDYCYSRKQISKAQQPVNVADHRRIGWQPDEVSTVYPQMRTAYLPPRNALQEVLAPQLAFLAGSEKSPDSEAANYWCGKPLSRTLAVLNDSEEAMRWDAEIELLAEDRVLSQTSMHGTLPPGGVARDPFSLNIPKPAKKTVASLRLNFRFNDKKQVSEIPVTLFPELSTGTTSGVYLFDPESASAADLKRAGIVFRTAPDILPPDAALVIVGKRELDRPAFFEWAGKNGLAARFHRGLNLLFLEQSEAGLRKLGLYTHPADLRRVFKIRPEAFPEALSDRELSCWHGTSTLVEDHPSVPDRDLVLKDGGMPQQFWRWNTYDMAAALPIRRPWNVRAVSILSGGLDMADSALLEIRENAGSLVFCQMEVSGRSDSEPAAAYLLRKLTDRFVRKSPENPPVLQLSASVSYAERKTQLQKVRAGAIAVAIDPSPEFLAELGLCAVPGRAVAFTLASTSDGKLREFSQRDLFFTMPIPFREIKGDGVEPLLDPNAISVFSYGKGKIYFFTFDQKEMEKRLEETGKLSLRSADYWGWHVLKERVLQLRYALSPPESNYGVRLEQPVVSDHISLDGVWSFQEDPNNRGLKEHWQTLDNINFTGKIQVPGFWETQIPTLRDYDGVAWYRTVKTLPGEWKRKTLRLHIGAIDDTDTVFINEEAVGSTGTDIPGYWAAERDYRIPANLTASGILKITIRVTDLRGNGGIPGNIRLSRESTDSAPDNDPFPSYNPESMNRW